MVSPGNTDEQLVVQINDIIQKRAITNVSETVELRSKKTNSVV